jgi:hypothetical protein
VEHIKCQFFSSFPIAGDPHDEGEDDSMCLGVERMQRDLIAARDGLDQSDPRLLGYWRLCLLRK